MSDADQQVSDFIGDQDDSQAVRWYGMYSLILSTGSIVAYNLFNTNSWVASSAWFTTNIGSYFTVFMGWVFVSLFDSEFMRWIFRMLLVKNIYATIVTQSNNLVFMYYVYNSDVAVFIWMAIWGFLTMIQILVQAIVLPQVFDWTNSASIKDNGADSLLAVLF